MPQRGQASRGSAHSKVHITLPELPASKFYAGESTKRGPKRKFLANRSRAAPSAVSSSRKSYTINYKLRVVSWLQMPVIPNGPSRFRVHTLAEGANRFMIPVGNLGRWVREEKAGHYLTTSAMSRRIEGGGRQRKWIEMERILYDRFRYRRAEGKVVRRSWFRQNAKKIYEETYPTTVSLFCFSNGWFRGFLSWHKITLRAITNKASQLPTDYVTALVNWMRFNRRNSQIRRDTTSGELLDEGGEVGRYRLCNICNMDQTPLPFEYLSGRTYNQQGAKTVWVQSSQQSGWEKRQATIQLTIFGDGVPRVKPLLFFRGQGIGATVVAERELYDPRVVVKFNPKAYSNSTNMVEWLEEQVIPVLGGRP